MRVARIAKKARVLAVLIPVAALIWSMRQGELFLGADAFAVALVCGVAGALFQTLYREDPVERLALLAFMFVLPFLFRAGDSWDEPLVGLGLDVREVVVALSLVVGMLYAELGLRELDRRRDRPARPIPDDRTLWPRIYGSDGRREKFGRPSRWTR